jgi:DNA-binding NarL/FixJ family response regulator
LGSNHLAPGEFLPQTALAPEAKVIVLSGFLARTIAPKVLELGASLYLEKGASPEEIIAAIEEVATKPLRVPLN